MDYKPLSGREFPRFSAIKTFFRMPIAKIEDDFDLAIFGVPFDGAVSYRPGCRFGPTRIREASSLGRGFHWGRATTFFEKLKVADVGDCPTVPISIDQSYQKIEEFVSEVLKNKKKFIAVGGDHSINLPILRAVKKHYNVPVNLIHFDAHLDTYPAAWGCEYHHGSFLRHAVEEGLVNAANSVQFGIRGPLASAEDLKFVTKHKIKVFTVDDIRRKNIFDFCQTLPKFQQGITYITYDIDNLDPAFAPGTGTPVPGGLTTHEVQTIFRHLEISNMVGGDIVEVSPPFDHAEITSLAAVDAMFEMLTLMAQK